MKYIIMIGVVLSLFACQKEELIVAEAKIPPVSDLKYTLTGDTALITWVLPSGNNSLNVTISNGSNPAQLAAGATSYKYGIIETNKEYTFTVKLSDADGNLSLGETVTISRAGAAPVRDVTAEQNEQGVLVKWTAPEQSITKTTIKIGTQTVEVGPNVTSYQFNNVPIGTYLINLVTTNSTNQLSNTVYLPFKVGATMVAYLGTYSDSTTMLATGDDDIVAGAKWLFSTYPKSRYISFDQVKAGSVDLAQVRVLWWNYDLETTNELPAIATDPAVVATINQYYKGGGNLLFNQFAARYFWTLGRMTAPYNMVIGGGPGFSNGDTWGIGVNIGRKHDQSGHPLYKGITMTKQADGRVTFPALGPGHREDHNTVIENIPGFLQLGPNDNEAAYNKFVSENQVEWLGQWDGIGDYWMAGVMEMKPKDDFKGSAMWIGIGALEWHQNSGLNVYQSNIEKLYKNAIDYLKTK